LSDAAALYAAHGRDGAWASPAVLTQLLHAGELWGYFYKDTLAGCCPVTHAVQLCAQTQLLAQADNASCALLPGAVLADDAPCAEQFFAALHTHLQSAEGDGLLCMPVKSETHRLSAALSGGFVLTGIRPLAALRPHYLLRPCALAEPLQAHGYVLMDVADTLSVSRLLEHGFAATHARTHKGVLRLCLQPRENVAWPPDTNGV
jgi:hypothetical protein